MKPLSPSSFNKWRCLIALAHIDNKLQPSERQFFVDKLKVLQHEGVTEEQMAVFRNDLKNPQNPSEFFSLVEDRIEKIDLLCLAYELFWIDGDFDVREHDAFDKMKRAVGKNLNMQRFVLDDLVKMGGSRLSFEEYIKNIVNSAS